MNPNASNNIPIIGRPQITRKHPKHKQTVALAFLGWRKYPRNRPGPITSGNLQSTSEFSKVKEPQSQSQSQNSPQKDENVTYTDQIFFEKEGHTQHCKQSPK